LKIIDLWLRDRFAFEIRETPCHARGLALPL
jgi:hypothetical protein